jgi:hypothetical protein
MQALLGFLRVAAGKSSGCGGADRRRCGGNLIMLAAVPLVFFILATPKLRPASINPGAGTI